MKTSTVKRITGFTLALLMVISVVACGTSEPSAPSTSAEVSASTEASQSTQAAPENDKVVTLQVFSMPANKSGLIESWWGNILKEKIKVQLEVLPSGDQGGQKLQALTASGELPDIVVFADKKQVTDAVRADLLVNLDEHLDKLPNVVKNASSALQFSRDYVSNDTGKAFTVGAFIGPSANGDECNWGPYLRWDLYKQLGMPQVNTLEDYLPLVKKMQELYPKTKDGQKVYGFSLFKDWDGSQMLLATEPSCISGIDTGDQLGAALPFMQVDFVNGTTSSILAPDSQYIRALKFYYQANQMGLVDPDSLTQRFDTAKEKAKAGRVLFAWWQWFVGDYDVPAKQDAETPSGYRHVPTSDYKAFYWADNPIGQANLFSIGAATKNLDACLRYVDFMYSTDGLMELQNGPKDLTWTLDEKGLPKLTDKGWDIALNRTEMPGGGTLDDGVNLINAYGLSGAFINPEYNVPISWNLWESSKGHNPTKLKIDWQNTVGYKTTTDMLFAKKMYTLLPFSIYLVPAIPDDIQQVEKSIEDIVRNNSWLMVFAKDQAEFDKLYKEMVDKANGLGIDKVIQWGQEAYKQSLEIAKKYEK